MTTAGWLMVTMLLASQAILHDGWADAGAGQWLGRRLLLVGMAFAAASSFREEKDSGGLELLLVTPLSPQQLVSGRLHGMFRQFAPSVVVLLLLQASLMLMFHHRLDGMSDQLATIVFGLESAEFLAWMAATAALGLALAITPMTFLVAFGLTAVTHHAAMLLAGLPRLLTHDAVQVAAGVARFSQSSRPEWSPMPVLASLLLALLTLSMARQLAVERLERRKFLRGK